MNYYVLIALCVIVIFSYAFELTGKYTKIPGVILLIITGMIINSLTSYFNIRIPDLSGQLPMMGTLGLILIVLEGSLDLTLESGKQKLIFGSILSSVTLFAVFVAVFSYILFFFFEVPLRQALINSIPVGIVSSAVAIPSATSLKKHDREFVIYESSISDIIGILIFDFVIANHSSIGKGLFLFIIEFVATIVVSIIFSAGLAYILHRIHHHVKYIIITTAIILVYSLAKLIHMPSLLVVLIFGMAMNNNHLFRNRLLPGIINFEGFDNELNSFKHITGELTFIIRSFFFIMFGFYTDFIELLDFNNLAFAAIITTVIFLLRGIFLKSVLKLPLNPLLFFSPRGLITILLFLSIPAEMKLPFMSKGFVTQVIFLSILMMTFGNVFLGKVGINLQNKQVKH